MDTTILPRLDTDRPRYTVRGEMTGGLARSVLRQMLPGTDTSHMGDATAVRLLAAVGPVWAEPDTPARRDHLDRLAAGVAGLLRAAR